MATAGDGLFGTSAENFSPNKSVAPDGISGASLDRHRQAVQNGGAGINIIINNPTKK
jgi:hypothetical protein